MGWLLGRKKNQKPDYTGLQLNTAVATLPIPILWGQNKLAGNLVWYNGFTAYQAKNKGKGGKGGILGGGGDNTTTNYRADIILAMCEGSAQPGAFTWKNQSIYAWWYFGFQFYSGIADGQVWPWTSFWYPSQALSYAGTAYFAAAWYQMGTTPTIGNLTFEMFGNLAGTGSNHIDANPALVIEDFLTNPRYGAGFDPASIDTGTLHGNPDSLDAYCSSLGIAMSPLLSSQETASSILARWLQICNCSAVWTGGKLKFIPYGDTAIVEGDQTTYTRQFSIPADVNTDVTPGATYALPAVVVVSSPEAFVSDGGVVYSDSGIPLLFTGIDPITLTDYVTFPGTYAMTQLGSYRFSAQDTHKPVTITYTLRAAAGFAPLLDPVYDLGEGDYVVAADEDPVSVQRPDINALPTIQRVEVTSRSNAYSTTTVEARDQAQIEMYGAHVGPSVTAHEICDEFTMGPTVAQLILQRALYVRATYTFKLSWEFCLLDPMDIVTITDEALGLVAAKVRITTIEEGDDGLLSVTAEELVSGIGTAMVNPSAGSGGPQHDFNRAAVAINNPLLYQPPTSLTGGVAQIWAGASPSPIGASTQWGGANVYASLDNATYMQVATITHPLNQGVLSAYLPVAIAGADNVNTLSVDLTMSGGTLLGVDPGSASLGVTRSVIENELVSFTNATLTAANAYNLTGLYRGLNGSTPTAHATGVPFARLDDALITYDIPSGMVGQMIYFKFQSFNAFGSGLQDLSTCAVYTVVVGSAGTSHPIAIQLHSGVPLDLGAVIDAAAITDDFGGVSETVGDIIDLGLFAVVAHPIATQLASGPLDLGTITSPVSVTDDFGAVVDPPIHTSDLGTVP